MKNQSSSISETSFVYTKDTKFKKGTKNYKRWLVSEKLNKIYDSWEQQLNGNWHTYGRENLIICDENGNKINN